MRKALRSWLVGSLVALWLGGAHGAAVRARKPAVLFVGGVHSRYVVKPLHELGIEVGTCKAGELAARLASGKFNVVVAGTLKQADRKALADFLERGGGALVCNPHETRQSKDWAATNQWLADRGARPRWEVLQDGDPKNVVSDVMRCRLSWSDQVLPPVNDGVRGVLTLLWHGTTGCEPPMPFDVTDAWRVVVRGAASMKARASKRHDAKLQPWKPTEPSGASPTLMALRQAGKGRLAVVGIRYYWLFAPPSNCPTTQVMLTAGAGGKPSDWLRVVANAFRWLAEPSLMAGMGGATTPEELLDPPVKVWTVREPLDWSKQKSVADIPDQLQTAGLIGARTELSSGSGTVAGYVGAAKAAGLQFIVFLEDSLKMNQAKWDQLVAACEAASNEDFAAVPGLTYEDAQGNHLYAFADEVKFPKPSMLLKDGRLATTQTMRSRAYFDYVNELMRQHIISGFWRHKENWLHPADYKLYNSFPIVSFVDGKPVDSAFGEYQYQMSIGACQAALAFEIMTSPAQVAERTKSGWRVVAHRPAKDLRTKWHHGAWSFSGSGSQYITNGPKILVWQGPNRLAEPRGEFWRPDLWQFRVQLRVASDAGLKTVTLYDGERVFRRWLPKGAKSFEADIVLSNCQQMGLYPVVEDVNGRRAIGMEFWNRNLVMEEFFCSDRCNFLGNCRLRTRDGRQTWTQVSFQGNMGITPSKGRLNLVASPAVALTLDSPTLPIDGRPMGFPTVQLRFNPSVPGEHKFLFAYPRTHLVSPEVAIGQADVRLAYAPAEEGAKATRLGHPYQQPQHGYGNAWGSWHRLVPTKNIEGWARIYACNWLPETFRIGGFELDVTIKDDMEVGPGGLQVMSASMPGWVVRRGEQVIASPADESAEGPFDRGTFATLEHAGGSAVIMGTEAPLRFRYRKGGHLTLHYVPAEGRLRKGERVGYGIAFAGAGSGTTTEQMLHFARAFGVADPGKPIYRASVTHGRVDGTLIVWGVVAQDGWFAAKMPKCNLPGYLPAMVRRLNDDWSAFLVDKNRKGAQFRAIPVREGFGYAQLDPAGGDLDLFIGHPVVCGWDTLHIQVAWMQPGRWYVEAHNPTDEAITTTLRSVEGWPFFQLREQVDLKPGTSKVWRVKGKP